MNASAECLALHSLRLFGVMGNRREISRTRERMRRRHYQVIVCPLVDIHWPAVEIGARKMTSNPDRYSAVAIQKRLIVTACTGDVFILDRCGVTCAGFDVGLLTI